MHIYTHIKYVSIIYTASLVRGLRPVRAFETFRLNVPKSLKRISFPLIKTYIYVYIH
jgi:hypothetical protein